MNAEIEYKNLSIENTLSFDGKPSPDNPRCSSVLTNDDETEEIESVLSSNNETDTLELESQSSIEWTSIFDTINEDDMCDMEEQIKEYVDEYVKQMTLQMSLPNFYKNLVQEISQHILEEWIDAGICQSRFEEHHFEEIVELVERLCISHLDIYQKLIPFLKK